MWFCDDVGVFCDVDESFCRYSSSFEFLYFSKKLFSRNDAPRPNNRLNTEKHTSRNVMGNKFSSIVIFKLLFIDILNRLCNDIKFDANLWSSGALSWWNKEVPCGLNVVQVALYHTCRSG